MMDILTATELIGLVVVFGIGFVAGLLT